ncbi:hypothetical protein MMC30_000063 [Trapelia coarctata]|nr:hypothetical protein [Trapelia coarctata]
MSWRNGDTVLWISLCVLGISAFYAATAQLQAVRKASEVTEEEDAPELISQHTEDAVESHTLQHLAFCSNPDLRAAASKIILERACQPPCVHLTLRQISSKDPTARDKAIMILKFLIQTGHLNAQQYLAPIFKALLDALCAMTNTLTSVPADERTTHNTRTEPERTALQLLGHFASHSMQPALREGLVARWLAHYPFGGAGSSETRRVQIVAELRRGIGDDAEMNRIMIALDNVPEGRRQLRKYGLMGSAIGETPDEEEGRMGVGLVGIDTGGGTRMRMLHPLAHTNPGAGVREENAEEQALRRMRREAMVLSDGGGPLGSADIIPGRAHDAL